MREEKNGEKKKTQHKYHNIIVVYYNVYTNVLPLRSTRDGGDG